MKRCFFGAALAVVFFIGAGAQAQQAGRVASSVSAFSPLEEPPIGSATLISAKVWSLFRQAEARLDAGDTSSAFLFVEEARRTHAEEISSMAAELKRAVSDRDISRTADRIPVIYSLLVTREDFAATAVIDRILSKRDAAFFSNSFSALLSWLENATVLPEADVFTGVVYEADGEHSLALSFYERAWESRGYFDVPGDKITLAYRMADLAAFMGNQGARENYLLLALADDNLFGTPGNESQPLLAMMRTAQEDASAPRGAASGVSGAADSASPAFVKFFTLYRNNNPQGLKAYRELADLYLDSGRIERALPAAVLSAVTAFTLLENAVREYEFEYSFSSFADTINKAARHGAITAWASESKIWDSFLQLGIALMRAGSRDFAMNIWLNMSLSCPDRAAAEKASGMMNLAIATTAG